MKPETNTETAEPVQTGSDQAVAPVAPNSASSVRLYEITAIISRAVVIAATSEEEALAHVETWEKAWETSSDLIGVSDVGLLCVRDMKTEDWEDEAHEATSEALSLLNAQGMAAAACASKNNQTASSPSP